MGVLDEAIKEHLALKRRNGADPGEVARLEHEAFGPITREAVGEAPAEEAAGEAPGAAEDAAYGAPLPHDAPPAEDPLSTAPDRSAYLPPEPPPAAVPEPPGAGGPAPLPPEPPAPDRSAYLPPQREAAPVPEPPREATPPSPAADAPLPPADPPRDAGGASPSAGDPATPPDPVPAHRDPWDEPAPGVDQPTQAYSLEDLEALDRREGAAEAVPEADVVPGEHDVLEETPDFLEETPEHDRLWFEQKPPKDFDF